MALSRRIARILVVEDDDPFRELMIKVLRRQGHVVVGENNGETALNRLREEHFDLLVTDLVLPRKMGKELLEELYLTWDEESDDLPPVILMSGVFREKDRDQFLQAHLGVRAFLHKPFTLPEFLKTVNGVLREGGVKRPRGPVVQGKDADAAQASEPTPTPGPTPAPEPVAERAEVDRFEELSKKSSTEAPRRPSRGKTSIGKQKIGKRVTVRFRSPSDFLQEYADNIGNGGIFIRTNQPPEVGTRIDLHLIVPMGQDKVEEVQLEAEVVYVRQNASRGLPAGLGVEFVKISAAGAETLQRVAAAAYQDARTGRPLLVLIYRMVTVLEEFRKRIPGADFRIREMHDASRLPIAAAGAEPADLILIDIDDVGMITSAVHALKSDPATARITTLVTGPESARSSILGAGADGFFTMPLEEDSFLTLATHLLSTAQRRQFVRARFRGEVRLNLTGVTLFADALDLSEGGLGVIVRGRIEKGQSIHVELDLGGPPVRAKAEIMWAGAGQRSGTMQAGIRFEEISDEDKNRIRKFIAEAIRLSNYVRWVAGAS